MRILVIAAGVALMLTGVMTAAPIILPPEGENVIEGHTVFTVVELVSNVSSTNTRYAASVAFLVREARADNVGSRNPGVLWFNDQYLTLPSGGATFGQPQLRYPCGAAIAVNDGDPVPYDLVSGMPVVPPDAVYVESYHIEPPIITGGSWDTDKWLWNGKPMWSVAVGSGFHSESRATMADDGDSQCGVASDFGCNGATLPITGDTPTEDPIWHDDPTFQDNRSQSLFTDHEGRGECDAYALGGSARVVGDQSPTPRSYPCGPGCPPLQFNALMFFFLEDLSVKGLNKNHTDHSTDYDNDVSGCQADSANWACPANDDDREGNSHPYNPMRADDPTTWYPAGGIAEGRNNHGGSADCTADGAYDQYCHQTNKIDLYFGYRQALLPARNWVVFDHEGSTAPYHCHEDITFCNENDVDSRL